MMEQYFFGAEKRTHKGRQENPDGLVFSYRV